MSVFVQNEVIEIKLLSTANSICVISVLRTCSLGRKEVKLPECHQFKTLECSD